MIAYPNPPVPFDYRTICTIQAAVLYWDERHLPEKRKQPMETLTFTAQGAGQFPELDAEELHKLMSTLAVWAHNAKQAEEEGS